MTVIGLDGFKKGWVAVAISGTERSMEFLPTLAHLANVRFELAMVDIPIGLPDLGKRECDLQARALLRSCASRVFTGARRDYWEFDNRESAHRHYKGLGDSGISCQLWCLAAKISEADAFMSPERQRTVRETHPELAFWRMHGERMLPSKKTPLGIQLRRDLLRNRGFEEIDDWLETTRIGTGAAADDILDACACALIALDATHRVPVEPPLDRRGLRMEIWY